MLFLLSTYEINLTWLVCGVVNQSKFTVLEILNGSSGL